MADDLRKILAIELGGLGDLLLATPSLRALKRRYPDAALHVLAIPRSAEIIEGLDYVDEVRLLDLADAKPSRWLLRPASLPRLLRALWALRCEHYDATVNLRTISSFGGAVKMAAVFWCCGSALKAGRDTEGRGFFLNRRVPEKDFDQVLEAEFAARVVRALDARVDDLEPDLPISDGDRRAVDALLHAHGLGERALLGLNPGAAWPSKIWPVERFAHVADAMSREFGCDVVVTGSPGERPLAEQLVERAGAPVVSLAGETSLKQLAALIQRVRVYITNDTGPMHIAAAVGARLIGIFGPGEYDRYKPIGPADRVVALRANVDCSPCPRYACESMKCLFAISVHDVLAEARRLWQAREDPSLDPGMTPS